MNPEILTLQNEVQDLKDKLNHLTDIYYRTHFIDKDVFQNPVYFNNGVFGNTTGLQIGKATTDKLGFYGKTPIVQGASIADPSGGATVDSQARTAVIALITRLETLGLIAIV